MSDDCKRQTVRPSISEDLYNRAEMYCIGEDEKPNRLFEYAFMLMFTEGGGKIEGIKRLEHFAEEHDVEPQVALNQLLLTILEEDGDAAPKFKLQLERSVDEEYTRD